MRRTTWFDSQPDRKRGCSSGSNAIFCIECNAPFANLIVGVLTGPLYDLGYLKGLISSGTSLVFFGYLLAGEVNG